MYQSDNATVQIGIKHFINDNSGVKALSNHLGTEDTTHDEPYRYWTLEEE